MKRRNLGNKVIVNNSTVRKGLLCTFLLLTNGSSSRPVSLLRNVRMHWIGYCTRTRCGKDFAAIAPEMKSHLEIWGK